MWRNHRTSPQHSDPRTPPTAAPLFDAAADSGELENVIDVQPERAAELRAHAERLLAAKETPWGVDSEKVVIDEMQLNQLRALGYSIR